MSRSNDNLRQLLHESRWRRYNGDGADSSREGNLQKTDGVIERVVRNIPADAMDDCVVQLRRWGSGRIPSIYISGTGTNRDGCYYPDGTYNSYTEYFHVNQQYHIWASTGNEMTLSDDAIIDDEDILYDENDYWILNAVGDYSNNGLTATLLVTGPLGDFHQIGSGPSLTATGTATIPDDETYRQVVNPYVANVQQSGTWASINVIADYAGRRIVQRLERIASLQTVSYRVTKSETSTSTTETGAASALTEPAQEDGKVKTRSSQELPNGRYQTTDTERVPASVDTGWISFDLDGGRTAHVRKARNVSATTRDSIKADLESKDSQSFSPSLNDYGLWDVTASYTSGGSLGVRYYSYDETSSGTQWQFAVIDGVRKKRQNTVTKRAVSSGSASTVMSALAGYESSSFHPNGTGTWFQGFGEKITSFGTWENDE